MRWMYEFLAQMAVDQTGSSAVVDTILILHKLVTPDVQSWIAYVFSSHGPAQQALHLSW